MGGGKLRPAGAKNPPKRQLPRQNVPKPASTAPQGPAVTKDGLPINWPSEVKYLAAPCYSKYVTASQLDVIRKPPPPPAPLSSSSGPAVTTAEPVIGENDIIPFGFATGPCAAVQIHRIDDPSHPAYGQCGLFAARDLRPGELILPYYGVVHPGNGGSSTGTGGTEVEPKAASEGDSNVPISNPDRGLEDGLDERIQALSVTGEGEAQPGDGCEPQSEPETTAESLSMDQDQKSLDAQEKEQERLQHEKSDYDLWLSREADLAVDAELMGNEARFVNDYRGVPGKERANAEVKLVWDERIQHVHSSSSAGENTTSSGRGEWTMAVYVLPLSKKARMKILEAQNLAAERQMKKGKKGTAGGGSLAPATTTKMSGVGVIRKGEEILVSYGRGFWERRREEGLG